MVKIERIKKSDIERMCVYENDGRLTLRQIIDRYHPDAAFTGTFYSPRKWKPVCPVKSDGREMYTDYRYNYRALGWNYGSDVHPVVVGRGGKCDARNYIANCQLIVGGHALDRLEYGADVGGRRGRVAVGISGDDLVVYAANDGSSGAMNPEQLRDYMYKNAHCTNAIMLDGGGKVNFYSKQSNIMMQGKEPSQNLVLIWLNKSGSHKKEEDKPMSKKHIVCLDAGHSASNHYNKSPDGKYFEHEFALNMAKRIKKYLESAGVTVVETRPDGRDVSLGERCRISNNARADLFVSLHSNATAQTKGGGWTSARGWECLVYKDSGNAHKAAQAILSRVDGVASAIRPCPIVERPKLYVLHQTAAPAVLIEHGFHTNESDVALMSDPVWRRKMAHAEALGILDYLGIKAETPDQDIKPEKPAEPSESDLAIKWAQDTGILMGNADGDLMLDKPVTRRQFCVMMHRFKNLIDKG